MKERMFMSDDAPTFLGEWPFRDDTSNDPGTEQVGVHFIGNMDDGIDWIAWDNEMSPLYATWEPDFIWGLADDP